MTNVIAMPTPPTVNLLDLVEGCHTAKAFLDAAISQGVQPTAAIGHICQMTAAVLTMNASLTGCDPADFFLAVGDDLEWETPSASIQIGRWAYAYLP